MERHFQCTVCGKCCYGCLPLTLADAFAHAGRFPLAMVWSLVPQGSQAYHQAALLGAPLKPRNHKQVALLIVPTAYLPAAFPCPELAENGHCAIHADKPARCRTMPFYPYRDEQHQADLLKPRKGWLCDTSTAAPVVYRDNKIVQRDDFTRERNALVEQVPLIRTYAEYVLKFMPWVVDSLVKAGTSGNVVTGMSSFLTATRHPQAGELATRQEPVLADFAARTANQPALAEFTRNYTGWAKEMAYLARRR